mmetsp:Transcript_6186/g.10661  ORF Transcript_6186/g.10661 Transcript_6186/m.10661 type:complete len:288 (-) Transcript_6186:620-1483(-)
MFSGVSGGLTTGVGDGSYISILYAERDKLAPFKSVLPTCSRLLDAEILRVQGNLEGAVRPQLNQTYLQSAMGNIASGYSGGASANYGLPNMPQVTGFAGGSGYELEPFYGGRSEGGLMYGNGYSKAFGPPSKRVAKVFIPVDKYPEYNFVGRILGPRGYSLRRLEDTTRTKILIRGKGSVKDKEKEENFRSHPGFEHLKEPLHVLIEAELPEPDASIAVAQAKKIIEELCDPTVMRDKGYDDLKREQLRELAMLNGTYRGEPEHERSPPGPFYGSKPNSRSHPYSKR